MDGGSLVIPIFQAVQKTNIILRLNLIHSVFGCCGCEEIGIKRATESKNNLTVYGGPLWRPSRKAKVSDPPINLTLYTHNTTEVVSEIMLQICATETEEECMVGMDIITDIGAEDPAMNALSCIFRLRLCLDCFVLGTLCDDIYERESIIGTDRRKVSEA
jgi:hypothetical protein